MKNFLDTSIWRKIINNILLAIVIYLISFLIFGIFLWPIIGITFAVLCTIFGLMAFTIIAFWPIIIIGIIICVMLKIV